MLFTIIYLCIYKNNTLYTNVVLGINKYFYFYYLIINQDYIVYYINLCYKSLLYVVCIFVNVSIRVSFLLCI